MRLLEAQKVQPRRLRRRGAPALAADLAAVGVDLQVEEARRALDIGQRIRVLQLQPLEDLPRGERPLELAHELLEVMLDHAVEIDELAVDVVQDLDLGRRLREEDRGGAGERLDVTAMGREQADESIGKTTLATNPGDDRIGHGRTSQGA